jgi:hypothetical protein
MFTTPTPCPYRCVAFWLCRDRSVGVATGNGLHYQGSEFVSQQGQELLLIHIVQTSSETRPTFYVMGVEGTFAGDKAAGA